MFAFDARLWYLGTEMALCVSDTRLWYSGTEIALCVSDDTKILR